LAHETDDTLLDRDDYSERNSDSDSDCYLSSTLIIGTKTYEL
jgi:hypothetical protein